MKTAIALIIQRLVFSEDKKCKTQQNSGQTGSNLRPLSGALSLPTPLSLSLSLSQNSGEDSLTKRQKGLRAAETTRAGSDAAAAYKNTGLSHVLNV